MTEFYIRKRFGNYFSRATTLPLLILVGAFLIYLLKDLKVNLKDDLQFILLQLYFVIIVFFLFLGLIISLIGFEGVIVDFKLKEIHYFSQILGFRFGKKIVMLDLNQNSYVLIFTTKYIDDITPLNASDSFYEVSVIDENLIKHQIIETSDYNEAKLEAYKLSKFLAIELKDKIKK